ncbi:VWA domain-containing protein [Streptomyces sp. NPDC057702]|uniref:VWA domain-containing protein n=1 Tax=unclassified Streptomyces TaxID=2593676 RepID=UPI0036CF6DC3
MGTVRGERQTPGGWARRAVVTALGGTAVLASLLTPAGADPAPDRAPRPSIAPVNYAVAVDESASLAPEDMAAEKAAASRIALGDVSSSSHASVFGFAAAETDDQRAVDPICPRTELDAAGRDSIGACVNKLRGRKKSEGTGTDFPSAIRQGVHDLTTGTDPAEPRVLFLLTDGKMDVSGSPQYGDPAHRAAEGERQLAQELRNAAAQRVQIWPLGFGADPDKAQLDRIAAGGYQKGCVELPGARPRASKVSGAKDVGRALEQIFAAAHCLRYEEGTSKRPPATLEVDISPLATVGSIVVDKADPEVTISYRDPSGHEVPKNGTDRDSKFELAGAGHTVEALKITDPMPGTWKVVATAPEGHRSLPVGVSVLWQGELRGAIIMDPPSPQPGEKATVTMRLQTREGYEIRDPDDYAGLRVRGELSGAGFEPQPVALADDGKGPDGAASDGSFAGTVRIPRGADGAVKVSGTLTASGLSADTRSASGDVALGTPDVTAALNAPTATAHPGSAVSGTLSVHNSSKTAHTLRLTVGDVRPGLLAISPDKITVDPGESTSRRVTFEVAPKDIFGSRLDEGGVRLAGTVTVSDASDGNRVLVRSSVSVRVTPEPSFWDRYWWAFVVGAAVLAVLALAGTLWVRQRRVRQDPRGLVLHLVSGEGDVLHEHTVGRARNQWYEFTVVEPRRNPRIERRPRGEYAIQRSPEGGAVLRRRGERPTRLRAHEVVGLSEGVNLTLGDEPRSTRSRRPRSGRSRATPPPAPTAGEGGGASTYDAYR